MNKRNLVAPIVGLLTAWGGTALHVPIWGPGPSLAFLIGGLATTLFLVWRRDLLAMILAHVPTDAWALLTTPVFSEWWK